METCESPRGGVRHRTRVRKSIGTPKIRLVYYVVRYQPPRHTERDFREKNPKPLPYPYRHVPRGRLDRRPLPLRQ